MRLLFCAAIALILAACSHPLEIVGEGDILSASGDRDCRLEQYAAADDDCAKNIVQGGYYETYYAVPRSGWVFERWENYCTDANNNECSFAVDESVVSQAAGKTVPPLRAIFTPVEGLDCDSLVPGSNFVDEMICAHNARRGTSPTPTPVPPLEDMTWDSALAEIAAGYARQCQWQHNPDRSDNYPGYVGENLALFSSGWPQDTIVESTLNGWVEREAPDYDYASNSCSGVCGHYTQVVWRNSTKVGCAVHQCDSINVGGTPWNNAYFVVCNYAPGGNYVGQRPY